MEGFCRRWDFSPRVWYAAIFASRSCCVAVSGTCVGIASGTLLQLYVAWPEPVITSHGPPNMDTEHPRPCGTLPTDRLLMPQLALRACRQPQPAGTPWAVFQGPPDMHTAHPRLRTVLPVSRVPLPQLPLQACLPASLPQHTCRRVISCLPGKYRLALEPGQHSKHLCYCVGCNHTFSSELRIPASGRVLHSNFVLPWVPSLSPRLFSRGPFTSLELLPYYI